MCAFVVALAKTTGSVSRFKIHAFHIAALKRQGGLRFAYRCPNCQHLLNTKVFDRGDDNILSRLPCTRPQQAPGGFRRGMAMNR